MSSFEKRVKHRNRALIAFKHKPDANGNVGTRQRIDVGRMIAQETNPATRRMMSKTHAMNLDYHVREGSKKIAKKRIIPRKLMSRVKK